MSKFLTGQFWMRWLFTKKNVFYLRQGAFIIYKVKPEIVDCKTVRIFAYSSTREPYFCVFKYARAVKQKVWNEAENRERDWGETLYATLYRFLYWFWEKNRLFCSLRKLGLGNQMVALLAPFEKPQWHGLPIEKRRWKFSIPVGLSSYISCGHSGHAEFYSFFQLDAAYWSHPVDRTLDLWLWSDAVGCGSICIELPT